MTEPLTTKTVQTCPKCGHAINPDFIRPNDDPVYICREQVLICSDPMHGTHGCGHHCAVSAPEAQTERKEMPQVSVSAGGEAELLPWQIASIKQSVESEYSDLVGLKTKFGAALLDLDVLLNIRTRASAPSSEPVEYQDGDLEKFFGIDPDFTGNKSTSEYVDEIRGAAPSPEGGGSVGNGEKYVRSADVMTALDSVFASVNRQQIRGGEVGLMVYQRLSSVPEFTLPAQPLPTTTDARQRAETVLRWMEQNAYLDVQWIMKSARKEDKDADELLALAKVRNEIIGRIASAISSTPSNNLVSMALSELEQAGASTPKIQSAIKLLRSARFTSSEQEVIEGPSSTEYDAWLETRADLNHRLGTAAFSKGDGYEIWRNSWLRCRSIAQSTPTDALKQVVTTMRQQASQWRKNVCLVPPTQYSVADAYEECAEMVLKCFNVEQEKQDLEG